MSYTSKVRKVIIQNNELFWYDWNIEHIKKHNVKKNEVEEALTKRVQARKGNKGRLLLFGYTKTQRLLAIVIKKTSKGYYVFSARDANKKEKLYL